MENIMMRLSKIPGRLSETAFLSNKGLSNEVGIHVFCYDPIQGHFNTRLSLSSSSVDEVIKKRILAKNENAENLLTLSYGKNGAVLKNLFTFHDAVLDSTTVRVLCVAA